MILFSRIRLQKSFLLLKDRLTRTIRLLFKTHIKEELKGNDLEIIINKK